ncbi:hc-toxin synthetase [Colletotrichum truncatum]|uniref:Hc-toxin synthetase n=1 Tax=Colletotrichum truncatum TaxID=5467 RepID=A0ACC3ZC66_COLTU|nr:hc-toxin synthetase [Colletotrichum truncatum]KAF6797667.1 hc-toxin synthetase [Colletotrichum truncatum]
MTFHYGKLKLVPRLHSVKFVFDTATPASVETPDEFVFDSPFPSGTAGVPEKFVFKSPIASKYAQEETRNVRNTAKSNNEFRQRWEAAENTEPEEIAEPGPSYRTDSETHSINKAAEGSFVRVRGPNCHLSDSSTDTESHVYAAWALALSSRANQQQVSFGLRQSNHETTKKGSLMSEIYLNVNQKMNVFDFVAYVEDSLTNSSPEGDSSDEERNLSAATTSMESFRTSVIFTIHQNNHMQSLKTGNYDFFLECAVDGTEFGLSATFNNKSISSAAVRLLLYDLEHILWQFSTAAVATKTLEEIQIMSPASQRHLLQLNRPLPRIEDRFIHDLINEQARLRPHDQAICAWDGNLSYCQLQDRTDMLRDYLSRMGVGPGTVVPILFEKSVYSIIAILGVIKAGGAIVALDPSLPEDRLHMIIQDVNASAVICSVQSQHRVPLHIPHHKRVIIDDEFITSLPSVAPTKSESRSPSTDDALYVVFTSGSTGKPKGVVITHAAFASSAKGFSKAILLDKSSCRVLQYSSFSFDISMLEIFTSLTVGACLCIPSEEQRMNDLANCISSMGVNWAMLTPSVASLIRPDEVPGLDVLCLVGEALPQAVADTWADHVRAINAYGPAECSAITIVDKPRVRGLESRSIGRPVNCVAWIVGENEELAPFGTVGEIVIEGPPVARGYLGDKAKTEKVFLEDPKFLQGVVRNPGRCYRTGDLGRMNPDGTLDYFGRKDSQVKINGQRVELGEIEHYLKKVVESLQSLQTELSTPTCEVAVELLRPHQGELNVLSAFIAYTHSETINIESESTLLEETNPLWKKIKSLSREVSTQLGQSLPAYMVPKAIVPCRKLPLSPSGKVDRKTLRSLGNSLTLQQLMSSSNRDSFFPSKAKGSIPSPDLTESEDETSVGQLTMQSETVPSSEDSTSISSQLERGLTPVEVSLRKAWAKILSIPENSISAGDDFFKLGGDSIGAIKVVAACRQLDLQINVANIFKNSILREMALVCTTSTANKTKAEPAHYTPFQLINQDNLNLNELLEEASYQCGVDSEGIEDLYPCTHMQEGLMAVNLTRPGSYTGRWIHPLPSNVDLTLFRKVWENIHAESAILRTRFATTSSAGSLQVVLREQVQWLTSDDLEAYLKTDDANPMFPGDSLNRFAIVTSSDDKKTFVWTIHHMLYDGWSLAMLCNRLNEMYHGRTVKPASDYRDFISYTKRLERSNYSEYWKRELRGVPQSIFPAPLKPSHQSIARAVVRDSLDIDLDPSSGLTMSTIVRGAWSLMIGHFSNADDIIFGATVSGRNAPLENIENIEGPTIATVPVRVRIDRATTILDFLRQVQENATTMIPFEQTGIKNIKTLNEDTKRGCEFQNLLVVQAGGGWDEAGPGPLGKPTYREEFTTFPVTCEVWLQPGRVEFATHVDEDVTSRVFVAQAIEVVKSIMAQLSSASSNHADRKITDLVYYKLPKAIQTTSQHETQRTKPSACVHDLISDQSMVQLGRQAIVSTAEILSYNDLETASTVLSRHLVKAGVAPGVMIPLCFEKSVWTIVAMLGVMKTGAAFVPLDPSQPISRLRKVIEEVKATILLTSSFHYKATDLGVHTRVIVDRDNLELLQKSNNPSIAPFKSKPEDPAYVIFTSGSTGTPKGVVISHSAFTSGAIAHGSALGVSSNHRMLQFSSYSFDASLFEILTTLIHGGTVCVPTEEERAEGITEFVKDNSVNFALLTPSVARFIQPSEVPSLEVLVFGGEAPDEPLITKWLDSGVQLFNAYGPSECSVIATIQSCAAESDPRTIGYPIGCSGWVVNKDDVNTLVPDGVVGELLIEGSTLAQGYLNDSEKTAASFINKPSWLHILSSNNGARLYKTGDLVRKTPSGSLVYVGRKDLQVKVNGQRIEIGEIESHLALGSSVKLAIVVFPSSGVYSQKLVAVLNLEDKTDSPGFYQRSRNFSEETKKIRRELASKIPNSMVPAHWIDIKELSNEGFPLAASGKVDRRMIKGWLENQLSTEPVSINPTMQVLNTSLKIGPDEGLAYELAEKIASLLPAGTFPAEGNVLNRFDDLLLHSSGLDSLNMMSLLHFIRLKYQVRVSIQLLMNEKTSTRSLAEFITSATKQTANVMAEGLQAPVGGLDIMAQISKHETDLLNIPRRLNNFPNRPPNTTNLTVFLTGASGYLGTQILRQLLEHQDVGHVVALARGTTIDLAREKVVEAAQKALWWTEFHAERLEVWKGDLALPQLGLHEAQWGLLKDGNTFDIVIHNGAVVHWSKSYSVLEAVNVASTVQLVGLAISNPSMRFAYISGGRQCRGDDERDEDVAQELSDSMGYSQSKFVAEVLVKRAAEWCPARQRNIAVFRPGLIIGTPTEGVANLDDYIWRVTAASIKIGAYNSDDGNAWLHLSDASTTAAEAIRTAFSPESREKSVVHHNEGMTWGMFWRLVRRMGFNIHSKPTSQWLAAVQNDIASRKEKHPLWPLAHLLEDTAMKWDIRVDMPQEPPLQLKVAVRKNIEYLIRAAFLPNPTTTGAVQSSFSTFSRSSTK